MAIRRDFKAYGEEPRKPINWTGWIVLSVASWLVFQILREDLHV